MSHMVIYRSVDGKPGFQQTEDLSSAVEFVERLRNIEGVETARIYRLEQVNFRFQPYYQVHLDEAGAPAPPPSLVGAAAAPSAPPAPSVQPQAAQAPPPPPMSDVAPAVPTAAIAEAVAAAPSDPVVTPPQAESGPTPPPPPEPSDAGNGIRRGLFGR